MFLTGGDGINLDGGQLFSTRVENVGSLPTTTFGVGQQVFYNNAPYWKTASGWVSVPPAPYKTLYVDLGYPNVYPYFSSIANAQNYARTNLSGYYVCFEIYNCNPEDITFTSTDNYIFSLKYNVASADYAKGTLTVSATYTYPFAITGNATLTNLYVSGGSSSYTSVVNVRKVTGNATFKANYKADVYITEANTIILSTTADTQAANGFSIDGMYCATMEINGGGTSFNNAMCRTTIGFNYINYLDFSCILGGEFNFTTRVIDTASITCGDTTINRHTYIFFNGTRITRQTTVAGHGGTSTQYYLYIYFRGCQLCSGSVDRTGTSLDYSLGIWSHLYAKVFLENCTVDSRYTSQYGIKFLSSGTTSVLNMAFTKVISTAASIYNPGANAMTVVAQYSTCRQTIGSNITITGTLTQNAAFF